MSLDKIKVQAKTLKIAKKLISHFDPLSKMEIETNEGGRRINIETEMSGLLIGRQGETLAALEHVLRLILVKELEEFVPLHLDVSGYRASLEQGIEALAKEAAERVKQLDRIEELRPMKAYERRLVHLALSDIDGIEAISEGEEPYRRIVIRPKIK